MHYNYDVLRKLFLLGVRIEHSLDILLRNLNIL